MTLTAYKMLFFKLGFTDYEISKQNANDKINVLFLFSIYWSRMYDAQWTPNKVVLMLLFKNRVDFNLQMIYKS